MDAAAAYADRSELQYLRLCLTFFRKPDKGHPILRGIRFSVVAIDPGSKSGLN